MPPTPSSTQAETENSAETLRSLVEIPPEVLLERLLPILSDRDLLALGATSKLFHELCNDESLWLHRTEETFSYNSHLLAPPSSGSGWSKRLYIGLSHPEPFVWGSSDNSRLGLPDPRGPSGGRILHYMRPVDTPATLAGQFKSIVPRPLGSTSGETEEGGGNGRGGSRRGRSWHEVLRDTLMFRANPSASGGIAGAGEDEVELEDRIVEMQAGGWSFAARDMRGGIWVWGQLDGGMPGFRSTTWADKYCPVPEPTRIPLPCLAEAMSVGRNHMLVLDEDNLIWEMAAWGTAYHHTSPSLTSPINPGSNHRPHHITQISTGWSHSACLTSSGKIYVWYPFSQAYHQSCTPEGEMNGPLGVRGDGDEARSVKWGKVGDIVLELEEIPLRPDMEGLKEEAQATGSQGAAVSEGGVEGVRNLVDMRREWAEAEGRLGDREREAMERVIKIASGLDFVVALKGNGEVWYHRVHEGERGQEWRFLPYFSSPTISHISAQFASLTTYSTSPPSRVYHARLPPGADNPRSNFAHTFRPEPLPLLQSKNVIQVAIGDYHYAALTSSGEMYTWGQGEAGQLGLGGRGMSQRAMAPDGRVLDPQRVYFPRPDGRGGNSDEEGFVFSITASGWHTGALLLGDPKPQRVPGASKSGTAHSTTDGYATTVEDRGGPIGGSSQLPTFNDIDSINIPGAFPSNQNNSQDNAWNTTPQEFRIGPAVEGLAGGPRGMPAFRIGFAGRGMIPAGSRSSGSLRGRDRWGMGPALLPDPTPSMHGSISSDDINSAGPTGNETQAGADRPSAQANAQSNSQSQRIQQDQAGQSQQSPSDGSHQLSHHDPLTGFRVAGSEPSDNVVVRRGGAGVGLHRPPGNDVADI